MHLWSSYISLSPSPPLRFSYPFSQPPIDPLRPHSWQASLSQYSLRIRYHFFLNSSPLCHYRMWSSPKYARIRAPPSGTQSPLYCPSGIPAKHRGAHSTSHEPRAGILVTCSWSNSWNPWSYMTLTLSEGPWLTCSLHVASEDTHE